MKKRNTLLVTLVILIGLILIITSSEITPTKNPLLPEEEINSNIDNLQFNNEGETRILVQKSAHHPSIFKKIFSSMSENTITGNLVKENWKSNSEEYISIKVNSEELKKLTNSYDLDGIQIDTKFSLLEYEFDITKISQIIPQTNGGEGISICVIDTGFNDPTLNGYNFVTDNKNFADTDGHGTEVTSILMKIAPKANYHIAKVIETDKGYSSDILEALDWCKKQNVNIISMSIGGGEFSGYCVNDVVANKVNELAEKGILTIAATGNNGNKNKVTSPACAKSALPVAASNAEDKISDFSNYNKATLLTAPGENIQTINGIKSGTSFSTPIVAGATALILEKNELNPGELKKLLIQSGDLISENKARLNALNAINGIIINDLTEENIPIDTSNPAKIFRTQATTFIADSINDTLIDVNHSVNFKINISDEDGIKNATATFRYPNTTLVNISLSGDAGEVRESGDKESGMESFKAGSSYERGVNVTITADTQIVGTGACTTNEGENYGNKTNFKVSRNTLGPAMTECVKKGLIRGNLAGTVPGTATIKEAFLQLYVFAEANTSDINAYALLQDWKEGNKSGTTADTGESNWSHYDVPNAWNTPGANGSGTDYNSVVLDTNTNSGLNIWYNWNITYAANMWENGTWNEYGILLEQMTFGNPTAVRDFASMETTGNKLPYIEVTYIPAPIDNEGNSTWINYTDTLATDSAGIKNITITITTSLYNKDGSTSAANANPDVELTMFNGTKHISVGYFDISGVLSGAGDQTTVTNFSITTNDSGIITAWKTAANRDMQLRAIWLDTDSGNDDKINWTGVYVTINDIINPWQTDWSSTVNEGRYNVTKVYANDNLGNMAATSITKTFNVSSTATDITGGEFNETTIYANEPIRFTISVTDPQGIANVTTTFRYSNTTLVNRSLEMLDTGLSIESGDIEAGTQTNMGKEANHTNVSIIEDAFMSGASGGFLCGGNTDNNYGASTSMIAKEDTAPPNAECHQNILAKGNVSGLISGSGTIIEATLYYYATAMTGAPVINAHYLLRDWKEGTKSGTASAAGECDYVDYNEGTGSWTTVNAEGAGTDRSTAILDSNTGGATNAWHTWDITYAAQSWDNSSINEYGIVLADPTDNTEITYNSDDAATNKPYIEITHGAGVLDNEGNSTFIQYNNTVTGVASIIKSINVTITTSLYNRNGSASAANINPGIELQIHDGTSYVFGGIFNISSVLSGTGNQTTLTNFSMIINDSTVLFAWRTAENRDIRMRTVYMDAESGYSDWVNWNATYVKINKGSPVWLYDWDDTAKTGQYNATMVYATDTTPIMTIQTLSADFTVKSSPSSLFNSTWNTSKTSAGSSNSTMITLPLEATGVYDFVVDWGDGNSTNVKAWNSPYVNHTYATAGEYNLTISGTIQGFRFNDGGDKLKITDISQWGCLNVGNTNGYFYGCENLDTSATDALNLTNTFDLTYMFRSTTNFNGNISNWDTSSVTDMYAMFYYAVNFNQNINNWDTSSVTDMYGLFRRATNFNQNLSNWDVSNVGTMENMFRYATNFNQTIGTWNTSKVTTMANMFTAATNFNQDIGNWNVSNVISMRGMFGSATNFNQDIGNWNVSKVTNMGTMFSNARNFNQDIGNWNVSKVATMESMFNYAYDFNQNLSNWDVSNVANMEIMFQYATDFNQTIGTWNTSKVTTMESMFNHATKFNQSIGNWDTSKVINMRAMFYDATNFNQNISNWDLSNVATLEGMFDSATNFNQDIGNWNVSSVTTMQNMFRFASNFNQSLNNWNVSNVGTMISMFDSATNFNQNLSNWNVSNVTNMTLMFNGVTLSIANYDSLLIGWASLPFLKNDTVFDGGNSQYCVGETARDNTLIALYNWTITDGGKNCAGFGSLNCSAGGCLYIQNKTTQNKAIFDSFGYLALAGTLTESGIGTPDGKDFILQDKTGTVIAWIDEATGNMRIAGTKSENADCTSPPPNSFTIENITGQTVTYIDSSGNLCLKSIVGESQGI